MDDTLILDCSSSDSKSSSSSSSNTGAIVGGVIGGLAGVFILSGLGFCVLFKFFNTPKVNPKQLFQIKNVPNFFHTTEAKIPKTENEIKVETVNDNTDKVNIENETSHFNTNQQSRPENKIFQM